MNTRLRYLLIANYINIASVACFSPIYALYVAQFSASTFMVSLMWGFALIIQGLMTFFFGYVLNNSPHKRQLLVTGYFLMAIAAFMYVCVDSINHLIFVTVVNACACAFHMPVFKAYVTMHEHKGQETHEWSLFDGGNYLLAGVGALIGGNILLLTDFRGLFIVIGALQLIAAIIALRLLKNG